MPKNAASTGWVAATRTYVRTTVLETQPTGRLPSRRLLRTIHQLIEEARDAEERRAMSSAVTPEHTRGTVVA